MVDINETVDALLLTLNIPSYYGMPEFGGDEPETYLVYDLYDSAEQYADDVLQSTANYVTVHIFSGAVHNALKKRIKQLFASAGFVYIGGGKLPQDDKIYPYKLHHYIEFQISVQEE